MNRVSTSFRGVVFLVPLYESTLPAGTLTPRRIPRRIPSLCGTLCRPGCFAEAALCTKTQGSQGLQILPLTISHGFPLPLLLSYFILSNFTFPSIYFSFFTLTILLFIKVMKFFNSVMIKT